ncbi:uncharacterized protein LOC111397983 [Olea europaea var. sylvestris]|uniref:uncharacterized protein LOC111397983 n=1 Tax=Olea europaea var. sylvestris TaxID=158386 RepID=UPI000C1CFCC0|nr:uncharacterized protein LOC111397983 [Olea europaea var. sylvestris]
MDLKDLCSQIPLYNGRVLGVLLGIRHMIMRSNDTGLMEFDYCIPEEARLRAHISQRSNLKYVKTVMDIFDDRQRDEFRNSPLWYLAEVAEIQFSAQLIQQLVFRTIRTDKVNELWFNVQGNMMRFGLQEYTLVTGLRCGVFPEGDEFDRVLERRRLKERYFKSMENISLAQLQTTIGRPSTARADRYKLGLVLIVEGVFNAPDNNVGIDLRTLSIVDDLDIFFAYPWGRVGYRRLLHGFRGFWAKKFLKAKRRQEKEVTYTIHGFPIAMQVWAYEVVPEIGECFGQRVGNKCHDCLGGPHENNHSIVRTMYSSRTCGYGYHVLLLKSNST